MKPVDVTFVSLGLTVFFLLVIHCPWSTNADQSSLHSTPDNDVKELIRGVHAKQDLKKVIKVASRHQLSDLDTKSVGALLKDAQCKCVNYNCGCCTLITVSKINLNETGCVNVSYLPTEYGMSVTISIGNRVIVVQKASVKNPPPACYDIAGLRKAASVCVQFYNLDYFKHQFSGCVRLQIKAVFVTLGTFELGCFHFSITGGLEADRGALALLTALKRSTLQ